MLVSSVPYKFTVPWANSASGSFITNPVPAVSTSPAAGQDLGFPPATALPEGSGGTPPNINDINGALYYATAWEQWIQAGAPIVYDATFQTAISGYPKGAIVPSAATPYLRWLSTVDNNTSDPDTGGANWLAMSGRLTKITPFAASATYTPIVNLAFASSCADVVAEDRARAAATTWAMVSLAGGRDSRHAMAEIIFTAAEIGVIQACRHWGRCFWRGWRQLAAMGTRPLSGPRLRIPWRHCWRSLRQSDRATAKELRGSARLPLARAGTPY